MRKNPRAFDLECFVAHSPDQLAPDVPVCLPRGWFQIHPDRQRCAKNVYVSLAGGQWWLVAAEVAEDNEIRIPKLWRADLYEAIRPDGRSFVLPNTFPLHGSKTDWYDTMADAVKLARKQWVLVTSDKEEGCFVIAPERRRQAEASEWPECEFSELVEQAFADRILLIRDDARKLLPRSARRNVDEFDE